MPFSNMHPLKFKALPTNAFVARSVNQMFGGSSQLPTTVKQCLIIYYYAQCVDYYHITGSSRKLGGAAEHSIDNNEKWICWLNFAF